MVARLAKTLQQGDRVETAEECFVIVSPPEKVKWSGVETFRVPVKDAFGRTSVLVCEDIVKCSKKAS